MKPGFKRKSRRAAASAAALALALLFSCSADKKPRQESAVALTVNGAPVTQEQVAMVAEFFRGQQMMFTPENVFGADEAGLRRGAARQIASEMLMLEDIKARGWVADSALVESMVYMAIAQFSNQGAFQEMLSTMGETEESMRESVRKEMSEKLLFDSLVSMVSNSAGPVEESEARAYYEANKPLYIVEGMTRATQIVLMFDSASGDTARIAAMMARANMAHARAMAGENFDKLVREYSSVPNHSDMGWFRYGFFDDPAVEAAVIPLKVGEISAVVTSKLGIHIMKKTDEMPTRQMGYEEAAANIRRSLEMEKGGKTINEYIDALLHNAEIVFIDPELEFETGSKESAASGGADQADTSLSGDPGTERS